MNKKLCFVLGGVGLVKGDIRHSGPAMIAITKEINPYLIENEFLKMAPFDLLHGIIRYGTKFNPYADTGRISKRYNELQYAVEVDLSSLRGTTEQEVKKEFLRALIPALFAISSKYELPTKGLNLYIQSRDF